MIYWSRVAQSQLRLLLHQWPRHYFKISYASSLVRNANFHLGAFAWGDRLSRIDVRPGEFYYNTRFFASSYSQVRGRKEDENTGEPRLNGHITGNIVRLVTDSGHNVVSLSEALEQAKRMNLDLVEVQRTADPPVCKIMDYHREKYARDRVQKEKERAKSKSDVMLRKGACKEVRFTKKTELKDLKMKADSVKRLMERGYRVKCVALPSARKYEEQEDLGALLSNLTDLLEDTVVESGPLLERKQAYIIVRHIKFGPSKKGTKKIKDAYAPSSTHTSDTSIVDPAETETEMEDEILLNKDYVPDTGMLDNRSPWAVKDPASNTVGVSNIPNTNDANRHSMDRAIAGRASSLTSNAPKFDDPRQRHAPETAEMEVSAGIPEPTTFENRYKRSEPANNRLRSTSVDSNRSQEGGSFRFEPQSSRSRQRSDFRREPSSPSAPGNEAPGFGVFSSPRGGGQSEANNSSNNNVGNRYGATRRY
ncbi:unnamed protein product [Linum trigynum]|uniref:Translation initiation factor 3 N-terminal domain-containing protein n=1 Tax=Linum trigynum TaxID=586398 RepID=A0AAV2GEG8_9ROSI